MVTNYPYYPQPPVPQQQIPYPRTGISYVDQTQPQMVIAQDLTQAADATNLI